MPKEEHCAFCWLNVVIIDSARSEQRKVLEIYVKEIQLSLAFLSHIYFEILHRIDW